MNSKLSLEKDKIKVVLLEGIHENAVKMFKEAGYSNVDHYPAALDADELKSVVSEAHFLGIRSRTKLTEDVIEAASKLTSIGCFCIGTNQVDLQAAAMRGIPVFNAPYSNTRSVAELVLGQIIMLLRGIPKRNAAAHEGDWLKNAHGSYEARGKTLGIIGYGHIGSQLSVLAESLGMNVIYFDVINKLAMGNANSCSSMDELLARSDVVSLHVPANEQTKNMITATELAKMKKGAHLINAARGNVIVIEDLAAALESGHLAGAAIDVFPVEPAGKDEQFESPLRGMSNVILTPHIGGSTQEAQENIGIEVADKLITYSDNGSTLGAVNFPEVSLPVKDRTHTRFMHIHRNVPGVLLKINDVFARRGINISGQYLRSEGGVGYVVVEVDEEIKPGEGVRKELSAIEGTLRVRFLF
ncbi:MULTISPECIES: phosphoglycerate dehydrogenase [Thalassospira]|uniref:D-3-phosphoglycerate dehydrogenase n=2 Tax=Thalassospira tepidiphila TaxID=393657 RepID=A0A853KY18_9PROT|nr:MULTISPECIES: phosphoglycerate dehydrogenase [Thalassospira]MBP3127534.1 phosphoglycerate dehydrogenase [Thalassospira sp. ER-Se-21-Dark]NJB76780.1 D-3-phosphoglycerate dehydrogenase [Thalassospira tepidiphila]KZC99773.1 D-3-phosphoglycerate dehydrogenase [Thalassospira sp. MCCC 1A02898]MBO6579851.1 phosphoglycerate dehydrogenase [Thalassospira sp.]MBO6819213.1 phosphoglycerate dehydrogenase [Thalassospira sp.]